MNRRNFLLGSSSLALLVPAFAPTPVVNKPMPPVGWVNVLDYGADPTGAKDSTAAFQNAASMVRIYGDECSVVYAPAGTYRISRLPDGNVPITGVGPSSIIEVV